MIQPHATEIEEAVLGAILLEASAKEIAIPIMKPEHFYKTENQIIFKSIQSLFNRNEPIDILTVCQELTRTRSLDSVGGSYFVSSLTNRIASSANIEMHARIVIQKYVLRKLSTLSNLLSIKANDAAADSFDVMQWMQNELLNIEDGIRYNKIEGIQEIVEKELIEIRESITSGVTPGIKTAITALNNQTSGWQNGDLIIIAGRPGMGKTSAALEFAMYPALNGKATAIFSLEMSKSQLAKRVLSLVSSMPVQKIVTKNLTLPDIDLLDNDGKILNNVHLYIDDSAGITLIELSAKARKMKREFGIELLIVDYLQLMNGAGGNREQEISTISRGLKALAKELEIPIIALSQLSRKVEDRPDKKPQLSDLRESGAIEQDADIVIFCLRPEYYGEEFYSLGGSDIPTNGLFIFIIAKFRQGQPGEIKARWIGELTKIDNY